MDTLTAPRTTGTGAQGDRAGAITASGGHSVIRVAGIVLVVIGAAAIGWGAATLARGRLVVPRVAVAGSLAGVLSASAAMALNPTRVSVFAVAAASALLIAAALGAAITLRRATEPARLRATVATPSPDAAGASSGASGRVGTASGARLVELFVAALLVAAVVTPALAATEAGQHAVPHGVHSEIVETGHH